MFFEENNGKVVVGQNGERKKNVHPLLMGMPPDLTPMENIWSVVSKLNVHGKFQ